MVGCVHRGRTERVARLSLATSVAGFGLALVVGCGNDFTGGRGGGGGFADGNRDTTLTSTLGKTSGEPNDTFADPVVAVFDGGGTARLQGSVSARGDLDVFLLGALTAGDVVVVDTDTTLLGSTLDVSIAIFDGGGRLVASNDDRTRPDLDSRVELIVRRSQAAYYLVVSHSAFAPRDGFTGRYNADVQVDGGFAVPDPTTQMLLLNFEGAVVDSPALGPATVGPFDAARIAPVYAGTDAELKQLIQSVMEQNFARFDVTIVTSDDPAPSPGQRFSTIHMGCFDPQTFGIAENVDAYNVDLCDDAIIFVESFSPDAFSSTPSLAELAVAIGNVTSHEAGHLMGLNHVDDDLAIMDDRSPADAFLFDQEYIEAPLSTDIMPIGTQDAALLLEETIGLR